MASAPHFILRERFVRACGHEKVSKKHDIGR